MVEDGFISFLCPGCHTEIEATLDMIGEKTECPACGNTITVPDNRDASAGDGIVRHGSSDSGGKQSQALKGRTIRIELGDDF